MKKTNKKGFTIVELVIVIAVIAILAAVLIPTFSGIVKNARISADTQVCKNLNTALAADEQINGKPASFADVVDILRDNGYVVANLNPTKEGNFYAWDEATNQILYLDEDFDIIYKSKDLAQGSETANAKWHVAVSTEADKVNAEAKNVTVALLPKSHDVMTQLNDMTSGSVVISENITINADSSDNKLEVKSGADIEVNLAGSTIEVDEADQAYGGSRVFTVDGGDLTISGGTINAANSTGNNGSYGTIRVNSGNATIDNMKLYNNRKNGLNVKVYGTATISNTTIESTVGGCIEVAGDDTSIGLLTINSGKFTQSGAYADHCSTVSGGATINIIDGTFTGSNNVVSVFSSGGTINIKGGDFTQVAGSTKEFFAITTQADAVDSIVNITGGTFNGKAWNTLTQTEWEALCGAGVSVVVTDTLVTLSITK